jgi:hypothetical protein
MVAHVVLLKPRADLTPDERRAFIAAFTMAATHIPTVRHVRVGTRIRIGAGYEAQAPDAADFLAIIEFDDEDGLQGYLRHPAHAELGRLFGTTAESALVFDFKVGGLEMIESMNQ